MYVSIILSAMFVARLNQSTQLNWTWQYSWHDDVCHDNTEDAFAHCTEGG